MLRWLRRLPMLRGRVLIGKDARGNEFYEVAQQGGASPRRMVLSKGAEYDTEISPAWTAWLRGSRKEPPHPSEDHFEAEKDPLDTIGDQLRAYREQKEGMRSVHAAAAKQKQKLIISEEPTHAGGEFTPGSWIPGQKKEE